MGAQQARTDERDSSSRSGAKLKPFNGTSNAVDPFLSQMYLWFLRNPRKFTDDASRVLETLAFMMEGTAARWASNQIRKIQEEGNNKSYMDFHSAIRREFAGGSDRHRTVKAAKYQARHCIGYTVLPLFQRVEGRCKAE
ncbi:hypothetical protein D9758_009099 [Tetrapyrgos nigripes]|uniref:DUF4939 domain-containing protein n=1 Tax=Tetrapyrgos nigripes TaxID=182062 RepID=A0A8H5LL05_9AGAR|nr:hypothetical protein D9758_009099 [Tetrapyrgos nigripes]